jgi:hypothetical protein
MSTKPPAPAVTCRFVSERAEPIHVRSTLESSFAKRARSERLNHDDKPFFERDWPDFLTGAIHNPIQ